MLLGLIQEVDLVSFGTYWLLLRVIFFGLYAFGIEKIRSLVWIAALVVLIAMGSTLLASV